MRSGGNLMSRGLLFPAGLIAALVLVPLALFADEPKEPKVLSGGSATDPFLIRLKKPDSGVVIRSAEELVAHSSKPDSAKDPDVQKAMETELAKFLKVERIDWDKQMVLAVQGHSTRGEYGAIKFDPLKIEGKALLVQWKQENHITRAAYKGPPVGFVLVERFAGEVNFLPREIVNSLGMSLPLVPRGKFRMGSPKDEADRLDEEVQHEVEITRPFYMGKHEVTVGQFKAFVKDTKYITEAEKDGKGGRGFDGKEFVQKPEFTWKIGRASCRERV